MTQFAIATVVTLAGVARVLASPASTGAAAAATSAAAMPVIVSDCNAWHTVTAGQGCADILNHYTTASLNSKAFFSMNPEINTSCGNLWANAKVCVGAAGGASTAPSAPGTSAAAAPPSTSAAAPASSSRPLVAGPGQTPGAQPAAGTASATLVTKPSSTAAGASSAHDPCGAGAPAASSSAAKPTSGAAASASAKPSSAATTTPAQATSAKPASGTSAAASSGQVDRTTVSGAVPSGVIAGCKVYHQVVSGDTCQKIVDGSNGALPMPKFRELNPSIDEKCSNLALGANACVEK